MAIKSINKNLIEYVEEVTEDSVPSPNYSLITRNADWSDWASKETRDKFYKKHLDDLEELKRQEVAYESNELLTRYVAHFSSGNKLTLEYNPLEEVSSEIFDQV